MEAVDHEVQGLIARLGWCSVTERRCAAEDLGGLGPQAAAAVTSLIERLSDENVTVVRAAACSLGRIRDPAGFMALRKAAEGHPDPGVRVAAADSLRTIDPPGY
jgi:hypothetical protein